MFNYKYINLITIKYPGSFEYNYLGPWQYIFITAYTNPLTISVLNGDSGAW